MASERTYGVGIIGFGGMGTIHYKQLAKGNLRARVVGIYDISAERQAAAREYGLAVYDSMEALLDDGAIDIVVAATPNRTHREIVEAALEKGKAVICEKPAAIRAEELEHMMGTAKKTGSVLTVDQNRRVNRDFLAMRREAESGALGKVYLIESRVNGSRGVPSGWRTERDEGGGMMLDWGVHLIDQLVYMHPERITDIYCRMHSVQYEVDDNFHLELTFADGLTAVIEVGTNNFISHPRWMVYGTEGTLCIDGWDGVGKTVRCLAREDKWAAEIPKDKAGPSKTMAARSAESVEERCFSAPEGVNDTIEPTYIQLFDKLEGKAELTILPEEALRVMKIMEAAFRSAECKEVVHGSF